MKSQVNGDIIFPSCIVGEVCSLTLGEACAETHSLLAWLEGMKDAGMNRGTQKRNLIALLCAAVVAVALLLPAGLQGKVAPSNAVSEVVMGQMSDQETPIELGVSPDAAVLPETPEEPVAAGEQSGDPPKEPEYVPGEILVGLADGVTVDQLNEQLASMDYVTTRGVSEDDVVFGYVKLELVEGVSVEDATIRSENEPLLKAAQPNYVYYIQDSDFDDAEYSTPNLQVGEVEDGALTGQSTPINDRYRSSLWALEAVHAYEAWDTVRVEGSVVVAVLDSGVKTDHEDLQGRLLPGYNAMNKTDDVMDTYGHGTHIAGIIAATANNGVGVAGVSYNAKILPIKVMDGKSVSTFDLTEGIEHIVGLSGSGAPKIVNISIGTSENTTTSPDGSLDEAIQAMHSKGMLVVYAGANNDDGAYQAWNSYPCDFDLNSAGTGGHPESIGVINVNRSDERAVTSNFNAEGKRTKTLSAPGTNIYSAWSNGGYNYQGGTSMAAPCVAGVAALVFAANPSLSAADVKRILEDTARDLGPIGWDNETGYGMVDAAAAVQEAARRPGSVVGPAPTLSGPANVPAFRSITLSIANGDSRTWTWLTSDESRATVEGDGSTATVFGAEMGEVTITAKSNDGIELAQTVVIGLSDSSFKNAQITFSGAYQFEYTGKAYEPSFTVVLSEDGGDTPLEPGKDYSFRYANNTDATDQALVIIEGKGAYANAGTKTKSFVITPKSLSNATVTVQDAPTYTGLPQEPRFTAVLDGEPLTKGVDFDATYKDNVNATSGTNKPSVTITGKGNYSGRAVKYFTINKASLSDVRLSPSTYIYSGSTCKPEVTVYGPKNGNSNHQLVRYQDYTEPTSGYSNAGSYAYTVSGVGNYTGSITRYLTIEPASLTNAQVTLSYYSTTYDGSAKTPTPTVIVGGKQLVQGRDYYVSYRNNVNAGTATVSVVGMGNYAGTVNSSFRILMLPAPTCAGATEVPVGATASYAVGNGGSLAIKSGESFATLSGGELMGKAAGTVVLSVRDSAGVERFTKTVNIYSLDGSWELRSAKDQGYALDITGSGIANGASMIVWQRHGGPNQRFRFVSAGSGYYALEMVHSGKRVDVDKASKARGHGVIQWPAHSGANQQWSLMVDKDNCITFTSRNSGMVIDVDGSRMVNGRRVIQWPYGGTANQKWVLVKCSTSAPLPDGERGYRLLAASASNLAVDVSGSSGAAGANVSLWAAHGGANQRFQVSDCGSGFVRVSAYHSGQVLDVSGGRARAGTNVIQWRWTGGANQKWKLVRNSDGTYSFLSAAGQGYALTWSGSARSGANLKLAVWTGADNQRFRLQGA